MTDTQRGHADTSGTLDEALERIHLSGPERDGRLSNHAPMAVEALVRRGQAPAAHRWLDRYRAKLEDMPGSVEPVTGQNWHEALGDIRRVADWTLFFERETADRPWRTVLAAWWPRLLPGIAGGATHGVIRVGHSVRTLLEGEETAPRVREFAHALGYWAARYAPLPALERLTAPPGAAAALDQVPLIAEQDGDLPSRLGRLTGFPDWPGRRPEGPEAARAALGELVRAATHRYATHGHASPIMLVHSATAPNAVLRTLPALPDALWAPSMHAAWAASAAVTSAYAPREGLPVAGHGTAAQGTENTETAEHTQGAQDPQHSQGAQDPQDVFARAAAHGDDHTIKFTDTALDVGDESALVAAGRAIELNTPVW
ncbi:questin oxidase family protein [Streptomyces sp. NPDC007346]|uniref:questin oxidase family protein n=1 Tax=Streptomyces sp. NPDC007346 TaxID=3154682 RepID=UPI0034561E10